MAEKAADNSTPITLISLLAARDLVAKSLLSPKWAELQILKWLQEGLVRWRYKKVVGQPGPDRTLEKEAEELWSSPHRTLTDFSESFARKPTLYREDRVAHHLRPVRHIVVIGIYLVQEDIEFRLAQITSALHGEVPARDLGVPSEPPPVTEESQEERPETVGEEVSAATVAKKKRVGSQERTIAELMPQLYGKALPEPLTPARLRRDIIARQKAETPKGKKPPAPPGWDACKRYLSKRRKIPRG